MARRRFLILILALAFGLRVHGLDAHPLWWDEGLTIHFGRLSPADHLDIAVRTENLNPPVYQQAVGLVMQFAGSSPFAARMLNVWCGTLLVALVYALARWVGARTALYAALLLAFSPFQLHYAQEAKGYIFIAALVLAGLWLWRRLHAPWMGGKPAHPAHWLAYALTLGLAFGSNYLVVLILLTENMAALWLTARARRCGASLRAVVSHWVRWVGVQALGAAMLIPFALAALGSTAKGLDDASALWKPFYAVGDYALNVLRAFTEGPNQGLGPLALCWALFALVGLVAARPRCRWGLALWLLGPVALGYLFQLKFPFFSPRFILYSQPALVILAAAGLAALSRRRVWVGAAGAVLAVGLALPGLYAVYAAPVDPEEDWRPLVADMRPFVRADDLAIYDRAWMPGYLHSYLPPAPEPAYQLGFFDVDRLDAQLAPLAADHARVWLLTYRAGLENPAGAWLRARYPLALARWYGKTHLALFVTEHIPCNEPVHTVQFAQGITLRGCAPVEAGDMVYVPLTWQTRRAQQAAWVGFVHLVDASGALVAQHDGEPRNGTHPTWAWAPGERVSDDRVLLLPPALLPGEYAVRVGLYDRDTHTRALTQSGAEFAVLGRVRLSR